MLHVFAFLFLSPTPVRVTDGANQKSWADKAAALAHQELTSAERPTSHPHTSAPCRATLPPRFALPASRPRLAPLLLHPAAIIPPPSNPAGEAERALARRHIYTEVMLYSDDPLIDVEQLTTEQRFRDLQPGRTVRLDEGSRCGLLAGPLASLVARLLAGGLLSSPPPVLHCMHVR